MTSVLICVAALWLTQRLLAIHQSMRFRRQLLELRSEGRISVGMGKTWGRRVYVGIAVGSGQAVTAALVLSGATVFAKGRPVPPLVGCRVRDLADGHTPAGLKPLAATATVQAAGFLAESARRSAAKAVAASSAA
jgi:DNA-binding transcriptional regulator of glucitol operon